MGADNNIDARLQLKQGRVDAMVQDSLTIRYVRAQEPGVYATVGALILNCPRVFARTGTTASFARFAAAGVRTVVGTHGYNMDMLGKLNAASMISKIAAGKPDVASAPELIASVTTASVLLA
jgi:ABC-type amino acid transport substrate-binding protein